MPSQQMSAAVKRYKHAPTSLQRQTRWDQTQAGI
jgi:hypothetical protein